MPEPFLIKKALDISLPTLGKSLSVTLKGLCVVAVVVGLGWGIYVTYVKPHTKPTPTQSAQTIVNNNYYPRTEKKVFLGLHIWGWDLGISKGAETTTSK